MPSYVTVARRIPALFSPEEIAKKRSANPKHLHRLKPRPGYIHAERPLDVCQIDHTPTDINFVEVVEGGGTFVGRAYLTIVTDVATRCILGFCLTLEKPSALSVALCLGQAMCPKEEWLAARGIEHGWPMFGRPRSLVTDSAKEFKGNAFQRGCEDFGIRIRYRDRGRVHQGGVVERLLGKLNSVLATQPGSTGRSVADRDQYPAERRARLSFADLERCVALAAIDHNIQENARTLKVPATEWDRQAHDLARFDDDLMRVLLAFMPGTDRSLSPQGISLFAHDYFSAWLGGLVPQRDRLGKLDVRYDPRDISHVYIRDPETREFRPVGRRDGMLAPLTLWEHQADRLRRRAANVRSDTEKVKLRDFINQTAEMATRFDLHAVPRWQYGEEFLALLDSLESALPLARASDLSDEPLARTIFQLSEGLIGEIVAIVSAAAAAAVRSGEERITKSGIEAQNYVSVTKRRRARRRDDLL